MIDKAKLFLDYLLSNGCTYTGELDEEPVQLIDNQIILYSQFSQFAVTFYDNCIEVDYQLISDDDNDDIYEDCSSEVFDTFDEFCDWYYSMRFSYTDDYGKDILKLKNK